MQPSGATWSAKLPTRGPYSWCWRWWICWSGLRRSAGRTLSCSSPFICAWLWRWRWCRICNGSEKCRSRLPLDLAALAVFLSLSHSVVAFWFVYLFVALAAGIRWGTRRSVILAGIVTLALIHSNCIEWSARLGTDAFVDRALHRDFRGGRGMSFLGSRQRRHATEQEFLAQITGLLEVDRGMAESLRLVLTELVNTFDCEEASSGVSRFGYRAHFCLERSRRRRFASHPGKSTHHAQRRLPAGPSRRQCLLEPARGLRRRLRLEPQRWTPPEGPPTAAGPHASGTRMEVGHGRHTGFGWPARRASHAGKRTPPVSVPGFAMVGTDRPASRSASAEPVSASPYPGPCH